MASNNTVTLNCAQCSTQIVRETRQLSKVVNSFCNKQCHQQYNKEQGIRTKTLRTCLYCKGEFRRTATKKSPNPRFCTQACAGKYKTIQPSRCHPPLPNTGLGLCATCYRKHKQVRNGESPKLYRRKRMLWQQYQMTPEQWETLYNQQNGQCPICLGTLHKPHNEQGHRAAAVDHDHGKSKRVRGLVCHVCNRSRIGKNTPETAKRLIDYLESDFDGREL